MARPTSRVSRVLMTGPLAPFAGAYAAGVEGARLYAAERGQRVASGGAAEPLAGGEWADGGGAERRRGSRSSWTSSGARDGSARSGHVRACCACWTCFVGLGVAAAEEPTPAALAARGSVGVASSASCWSSAVWRPARSGGYVRHAGRFLDGLGPVDLADVTAGEVIGGGAA